MATITVKLNQFAGEPTSNEIASVIDECVPSANGSVKDEHRNAYGELISVQIKFGPEADEAELKALRIKLRDNPDIFDVAEVPLSVDESMDAYTPGSGSLPSILSTDDDMEIKRENDNSVRAWDAADAPQILNGAGSARCKDITLNSSNVQQNLGLLFFRTLNNDIVKAFTLKFTMQLSTTEADTALGDSRSIHTIDFSSSFSNLQIRVDTAVFPNSNWHLWDGHTSTSIDTGIAKEDPITIEFRQDGLGVQYCKVGSDEVSRDPGFELTRYTLRLDMSVQERFVAATLAKAPSIIVDDVKYSVQSVV